MPTLGSHCSPTEPETVVKWVSGICVLQSLPRWAWWMAEVRTTARAHERGANQKELTIRPNSKIHWSIYFSKYLKFIFSNLYSDYCWLNCQEEYLSFSLFISILSLKKYKHLLAIALLLWNTKLVRDALQLETALKIYVIGDKLDV